jgi:hypothetical protein
MRPTTAIAALALLGGFAWLTQPAMLARLGATGEAAPAAATRAPGLVDPTPYRATIEAIEAVLYREGRAAWSDPETVASLAMQLGDRLYADLGPLRGRPVLVDLVDFATAIGAQAESGYAAPELEGPRAAWEALRTRWFGAAPWFGRTTAGLVAAQRPTAPTASLVDLHETWKWAGAIERFVANGRGALERHGEVGVDAAEGSQAERDLVARFQDFARDWDARVRGLAAVAPHAPSPEGEPNLLFAHQALEQAVQQLALATTPEGDAPIPMKGWRTQCLDAAAAHLEAARGFLAEARTSSGDIASPPAAMP